MFWIGAGRCRHWDKSCLLKSAAPMGQRFLHFWGGRIPLPAGLSPWRGRECPVGRDRRFCRGGAPGKGALLEMGFLLFLEYHSFVGKCTHISFVGDAPPSSFSPCAEKKKSAVHGGEEKEGFWVQTCYYNFVSILLRSFVEHGAAWRSVVTLPVLLTALRAGAGLGRCAVRSVFFCCASIARVYRGCTAADLFRCISLFAVAAQCAL